MKLEPTNYLASECQMTFGDFIIRYEHKFCETFIQPNNFLNHIESLKNCYQLVIQYTEICIGFLAFLNSCDRYNFINDATEEFVDEKFPDEDLRDIKNIINKTEIKNALVQSCGSVFKFNFMPMFMMNY